VPDLPGDQNNIRSGRQMSNLGLDLEGATLPYQPWQLPIVKERTENRAIDDPHIRCFLDNFIRAYSMPHLLKFINTPSLFVTLNELNAGYRQVFIDGRPLPVDPVPSLQGYSTAKWVGDTLVIDTIGMNDKTVVDIYRTPHTEKLHVVERWRKIDNGQGMEAEFTVEDPGAFYKAWTAKRRYRRIDQDFQEKICAENNTNIFDYHMPEAKTPDF